jgi:hypothetical protein
MTRCIHHNYVICGLHPIRPLSEQKGERCQMKSLLAVTTISCQSKTEVHTIILKIQIKFKACGNTVAERTQLKASRHLAM